ncbi:hypothetical protein WN55_04655, partial [Dufourea novaeangliae]
DPFGEDVSLLYPENHNGKYYRFPGEPETPIIKGVVNQLRKWPTDLFCAFLAVCLIIASLVFLVLITVAVCLPAVLANRCRIEDISITEIETSSNVYFFKLGNRDWSTKEFCYMETAARRHPDLTVYLINLLKEEPVVKNNDPIGNKTSLETKLHGSFTNPSMNLTPEERIRERLRIENGNIKNVNLSIEKFFRGSKLSRIARSLSDEVLEMAAKAQLLWSVPGIVIKPNMYCSLDSVKRFLCNQKKEHCLPDKLATIEPENDIQATGIPCQAFMGFLVEEISRSKFDGSYTLKEAIEKYCPRSYYCPELRILDRSIKCPFDSLDCPTVHSSNLTPNDPNSYNFVT